MMSPSFSRDTFALVISSWRACNSSCTMFCTKALTYPLESAVGRASSVVDGMPDSIMAFEALVAVKSAGTTAHGAVSIANQY